MTIVSGVFLSRKKKPQMSSCVPWQLFCFTCQFFTLIKSQNDRIYASSLLHTQLFGLFSTIFAHHKYSVFSIHLFSTFSQLIIPWDFLCVFMNFNIFYQWFDLWLSKKNCHCFNKSLHYCTNICLRYLSFELFSHYKTEK